MIKITDELLNKYIDNELDRETYEIIKEQLKNSPEDLKKLHEFQKIHFELKSIKVDVLGDHFTAKVMKEIRKKAKAKQADKNFIISISSFIMLIIFVLLELLFRSLLIYQDTGSAVSIGENISRFAGRLSGFINNIFNSKGISILGSVISLGLIISIYTFYEYHKKAKDSLSKLN